MIVAINFVGTNLESGTRTYNINFCKYLSKQKIKHKTYIFITKNYYKELRTKNPNIFFIVKSNYLENAVLRLLWMQLILPFELNKLKVEKFFAPMNICPLILKFTSINLILGLHSNLPWTYFKYMPGNFFKKFLIKYFMQKSIDISNELIVCSFYAKKEIKKLLNIKSKKIHPIYLGLDRKLLDYTHNKNYIKNLDYKDYIFSVISCARYHNIINLLKAFKSFKDKNKINLRFILIVQILDKKYFNQVKNFIKSNFFKKEVLILHNIQNKYLINLYRKASLYIFTSYSEVFGLTSLEAMSQKCPVIISNKSALPEINSNSSLYFDPDNIDEIEDLITKTLKNNYLKKKFVKRGISHAKKFQWEITVKKTKKVLGI